MSAKDPLDSKRMLVYRLRDEDDEADFLKPLEWSLIKRVFTYAKPVKRKLNILIVLSIIRAAQLPALVWITSLVIAGPISHGDIHGVMMGSLAFAILAILTDGIFHFRQRYALEIGETVVNGLRADLFSKAQRQPMSFFHRMKLGRILSRATSDVEAVRVGIQDVAFVSGIQFGQMIFATIVMLWWDWKLFLIVALMAPFLWLVNNHFRMKFSHLTRAAQDSFSRVTATLAESVNGIRVTQGFVRQEMNAGLFRSLLSDHSKFSVALARSSAILSPLLELNSQFFVAILLCVGGYRVFHGSMDIGSLIKFFLMANQFFAPITIIGNQYNQALVAMASAERIFQVVDAVPDWEEPSSAKKIPDLRNGSEINHNRGIRVEFKNLSFGYNTSRLVLHSINLEVNPGQSVALVGHTGSGKTSIINLVSKFYLPTDGEILIDGHEIRTITGESLHQQMGIVHQQNYLFSGTVFENIRLSVPDATLDQVKEAARKLDCLDILENLPLGIMTEVGEKGAGLSVGERQLICFCRAMLANPRLVILDEATSSIDAITEQRLQKALLKLLDGRTSFIVAHRLSTIRQADLVIVLDQGRIIERGRHDELILMSGAYASLHKQFVQVDDRTG
ncbi:MAG: ABC transporter ATP-binding protein [Verrucomicrobiota bacterium]|jgi:ATP-binding cassette subfamily B protein|nr:MAG: ABC transporter ATP-binding protein [Verrucomicrobiota bacterium]